MNNQSVLLEEQQLSLNISNVNMYIAILVSRVLRYIGECTCTVFVVKIDKSLSSLVDLLSLFFLVRMPENLMIIERLIFKLITVCTNNEILKMCDGIS